MYFVDLPSDVELAITGVLTAAVAFGVQWLVARFKALEVLVEYKEELGAVVAAVFVGALEYLLPTGHDAVAIQAVKLVLVVLAALGFLVKTAARRNVKGFKK